MGIGLTRLHNYINNRQAGVELATDIIDGLPNDDFDRVTKLRQLKAELNSEVCACYGWPEDTWRDENEVLSRLLALNQQLAG